MLRCSRVKFYQLMHCSGLCFREYRCRFTNTDTMLFCMRVMVGVIILYDHVHPVGAFAKTSKIDMKGCIKVLKEQPSNSVEGLLNALRQFARSRLDAQPTEAETAVWNQVNAVLEVAHGILAELQSYNGAGQEIREAIQNPCDLQLQEQAWNAVCPLVAKLKRFYEFSLRLENALRSLLEALTSPPYAPMQHLEREQALAKQFAEILHFTLSFDELKMTNPAIQNDFSYYRRTLSRNRLNNLQHDAENEVNNEMANRMSLFYAEATPMLKTLSNATTKFVSENKTLPIEDTTDCLSTMACVCRVMLETPEYRCRFTNTDTMLFCMRVMVGVIILYDHVHPVGAFAKTSKIDVRAPVSLPVILG
ncbi:Protein FAM49A [Acipenser ruthenus]|uniref:Protein FAM49A n=1 Tax=Acipenser ruthenus TaxID=7906 RepID=A0A444V6U8_ACIRT|nr:Protein FAM49A [Acipenser ruthenus]